MLFLICIVLIALIIVLQLKISKNSEKSLNDSSQNGESAEKIGKGIDEQYSPDTKKDSAFSKIFLGNIFNKIGAIAIIVALIFFIKLVSSMIVITPLVKLILSYVCGLGLVGFSLKLRKKDKMKNFSEVLLGTGFTILFITTFCGYSLFKILTPLYTVLIGSGLLVAIYYIAARMKTYSMIAIGLIGGYLTPVLSGAEPKLALAFLVFLNLISLVYTLNDTKIRFLNIINLVITVLIMMGYGLAGTSDIIYPVVLWAAYIFYDILREKSSAVDTAVCWINYFVLTIFTLWYSAGDKHLLGVIFGVTAIGYMLLSFLSRFQKTTLYKHYDHCILINLWLLILIEASDIYSIIAWALLGVVISWLITFHKYEYLKPAMWWYYASMFFGAMILIVDGDWCLFASYQPFWNYRTLCFGVPIFSMAASALLMKKDFRTSSDFLRFSAFSMLYIYLLGEVNSLISHYSSEINAAFDVSFARLMSVIILGFVYSLHARLIYQRVGFELFNIMGVVTSIVSFCVLIVSSFYYPKGYMVLLNMRFAAYAIGLATFIAYVKWAKINVYKYLAVFLGFMLIHCESSGVKHLFGGDFQYVISLSWLIYSGLIIVFGILRNINYLKIMGIVLGIITTLRILCIDLPTVDYVYKLIICLALGVVFMSISYLYTLKSKQ